MVARFEKQLEESRREKEQTQGKLIDSETKIALLEAEVKGLN